MTIRKIKPLLADLDPKHVASTKTVTRPWDGETIAEVEAVNAAGLDHALQVAEQVYQDRSAWLSIAQRIEIIDKVCQQLEARSEELAVQAAAEGGKPLPDSKVELARAVITLRSCIDYLRSPAAHGERIPMSLGASSMQRMAYTSKEPIGPVLAFSAFNHPINLIAHQVGPAVAAGCPVIVKPAEATPISCFDLVEMFHQAGLPKSHCQATLSESHAASAQAVADPRLGFFSFIGSGKVGWQLKSQLAPGTRCALEHGGAAPVILADDCDLEDSLPLIAKGGFYHAGQVCVSVQRVFAHRSIVSAVHDGLAQLAQNMKIADPTLADTDVGPLIQPKEVDRVEQWVQQAVQSGAQVVCGGERINERSFQCTVLLDPPANADVSQKEIFGPVICVYPYDDIEEAIQRANDVPFSFQSAVFTRSIDTAQQCIKGLDAAAVMVNDHTAFRVDWMPFAGHKQSGYGTGGTPYSLDDMQAEKLIVIRSKQI